MLRKCGKSSSEGRVKKTSFGKEFSIEAAANHPVQAQVLPLRIPKSQGQKLETSDPFRLTTTPGGLGNPFGAYDRSPDFLTRRIPAIWLLLGKFKDSEEDEYESSKTGIRKYLEEVVRYRFFKYVVFCRYSESAKTVEFVGIIDPQDLLVLPVKEQSEGQRELTTTGECL